MKNYRWWLELKECLTLVATQAFAIFKSVEIIIIIIKFFLNAVFTIDIPNKVKNILSLFHLFYIPLKYSKVNKCTKNS